jgi:hypothetical protein
MPLTYDSQREGWVFETEQLSGFLLPYGERHGIKTLVHKPTGLDVVHPKYDVLNLFLLFSTNLCMGQARQLERSVVQEGDSLVVSFAPSPEHKAELIARYTLVEPNAIDLTVTVRSQWVYPAYELFLSNYFPSAFRPHVYVKGSPYSAGGGADEWIAPQVNEVFVGTGLVFPRDQHAAVRPVDGRWNRLWALYQWNPQRYYAAPVLYQRAPGGEVAAVLMSRPQDCFAVVTGYDSPNLADPFKDQNPLYLSLFGQDLVIGSEMTAAARLVVGPVDKEGKQALAWYEEFMAAKA